MTDHAALRAEIARARKRWQEALRLASLPAKDRDTFTERLHDYQEASGYYRGLTHAGVLMSLGPLDDGETDGELQPE